MTLPPLRLLILGGTGEALSLGQALAEDARFSAIYSVAGRTSTPSLPALPTRSGGFGGVAGMQSYLSKQRIELLVDATHPFAVQITTNAVQAAQACAIPMLAIRRPAWIPSAADSWVEVPHMAAAAAAIGETQRRVLLTIGQRDLAPFKSAAQHIYLIRSVEPLLTELTPPQHCSLLDRGPFTLAGERALLAAHDIDVLVTKNSGGSATVAKLIAARERNIQVIMVSRPVLPATHATVTTVAEALECLYAHYANRPTERGV